MRIVRFIAVAGLLIVAACRRTEPIPAGDKTPVNAAPSPDLSATGAAVTGTAVTGIGPAAPAATPVVAPPPGTPPPTLVPSPIPPLALPRPGN